MSGAEAAGTPPYRLLVVTDRRRVGPDMERALAAAAAAGGPAVAVVLREHDLDVRARLALGERLRGLTAAHGAALFVADRVDLALALGADGVQLGWRSLPVAVVRERWPALRVGASCHDGAGLARAAAEGAHHATLGPAFPTGSHPGSSALGVAGLAAALAGPHPPTYALGGITPGNVGALAGLPLAGVAAVTGVLAAADPGAAVRSLLAVGAVPEHS